MSSHVVPILLPSGGIPGIDGSQNAINALVDQRSAPPSETERVREWTGGSVVGKGGMGGGQVECSCEREEVE